MATLTHPLATAFITPLPATSWLEGVRRDFGLDETDDATPILCLSLLTGHNDVRPIALVLETGQTSNILTVLAEFIRQSLMTHETVILIDFLPAIDQFGCPTTGCARRWVLDHTNAMAQLPLISHYTQTVMG